MSSKSKSIKKPPTQVDQMAAMKVTVQLAKDNPWWARTKGTTVKHLEDMLERAMNDDDMDDAKMGRWLGWMQAVLVMNSPKMFTLDDMKEINRQCKFKLKPFKK